MWVSLLLNLSDLIDVVLNPLPRLSAHPDHRASDRRPGHQHCWRERIHAVQGGRRGEMHEWIWMLHGHKRRYRSHANAALLCLQGIFISRVSEEGPAARAGVKVGDKLLEVKTSKSRVVFLFFIKILLGLNVYVFCFCMSFKVIQFYKIS